MDTGAGQRLNPPLQTWASRVSHEVLDTKRQTNLIWVQGSLRQFPTSSNDANVGDSRVALRPKSNDADMDNSGWYSGQRVMMLIWIILGGTQAKE